MSDLKDFVIEDGVLVEYNGPGGDVVIPDGVTEIDYDAFFECDDVVSVTIPDTVVCIGDDAFAYCKDLITVTIPESVTEIGAGAFRGCKNLVNITLPNSAKTIGNGIFVGCKKLDTATIPERLKINLDDFKIKAGILEVYDGGDEEVVIPGGVKKIGEEAFSWNMSPEMVIIPEGVTSIGDKAFEFCSLSTVTLPKSLKTIGKSAFWSSGLVSISLPESVTEIGEDAFGGCYDLKEIAVSLENQYYYSHNNCLIERANGKLLVAGKNDIIAEIPQGVTTIEYGAFERCSELTTVILPDGVTTIGDGVFADCHNLTEITVPDSVTEIGRKAFAGCEKLTIHAPAGSYAETYAKENNIPFVAE